MLRSLNPWITGLVRLLLGGLTAYAGLCLAAFLAQRRLMYFPEHSPEQESLLRATGLGLLPWRDREGGLLGWRRPQQDPGRPRVLLLHGNAGDALGRVDYLPVLEAAGFEGVLLEYPGYGSRAGKPSEAALVSAASTALVFLRKEGLPVFLLGESLGSGVSLQMAAANPSAVAGLLLVTPFARMTEVAAWHCPIFPIRILLRDRWDSLTAIRNYQGPVAILVAGQDEVVGAPQGYRLAQACPGPLKVWEVPQAGHNDLPLHPGRSPWPEMLAFLREKAEMGE